MPGQVEYQLTTEARAEIRGVSVNEPAPVFAQMSGNLPPREAREQIAQVAGDEEQLVTPLARHHRPRAGTPNMRQHGLPGAPAVVESRPFGVPHEASELIAIPGRPHRYPIDRQPAH